MQFHNKNFKNINKTNDKFKFKNNFAIVKKFGLFGFIDLNYNLITDIKFKAVRNFKNNLAIVKLKNNTWGFINESGKLISKHEYSQISNFNNLNLTVAKVTKDWNFIINNLGEEICEIHVVIKTLKFIKKDNITFLLVSFQNETYEIYENFKIIHNKFNNHYIINDLCYYEIHNIDNFLTGLMNENFDIVIDCKYKEIKPAIIDYNNSLYSYNEYLKLFNGGYNFKILYNFKNVYFLTYNYTEKIYMITDEIYKIIDINDNNLFNDFYSKETLELKIDNFIKTEMKLRKINNFLL
jgi:hypothetical protein